MRPYAANAFALPAQRPISSPLSLFRASALNSRLDLTSSEALSLTVRTALDDSDFLIESPSVSVPSSGVGSCVRYGELKRKTWRLLLHPGLLLTSNPLSMSTMTRGQERTKIALCLTTRKTWSFKLRARLWRERKPSEISSFGHLSLRSRETAILL